MNAYNVLACLDPKHTRQRGSRQWSARCPAHDDKSPSLSIKEGDDGRVLLHCFAGCSVDAITDAMGIDLEDLFPPRDDAPGAGHQRIRRPGLMHPRQAVEIIAREATLAAVAAANQANGDDLSPSDRKALLRAAGRIGMALQACGT